MRARVRSALRALTLTAAAAAIGAPALSAQSAAVVPAVASFGGALDSAAAADLAAIVGDARAHGLPIDPIVAKARLGILRHATAPTIVAAARAVADRLEVARTALEPRPSAADIAAGADALSAGVNDGALRSVRRVAAERPMAVPLGVLAQLVASGVPAARATAIVTALVRRGAPVGQLVALGNAVDGDVRAGERAEVSLGLRMQQLDAVLGAPGASGSGAAGFPATDCAGASCTTAAGGKKKP